MSLHAPLKKKVIRANHAPYMTKSPRKAIMRRSQLQSKYYKTKCKTDHELFKKKLNFVSKMYKKENKCFYKNLDLNNILDNKKFWKYMKPLFSDKTQFKWKVTLVNGKDIITEYHDLAETFNNVFKTAVSKLSIQDNSDLVDIIDSADTKDPVDIAIAKYKNHPSILKIKEKVNINFEFNFTEVSLKEFENQMHKLNIKKSTTFKNIPPKMLKEYFSREYCS